MFAERWVVMIPYSRKTYKGFTLIELMVVLFIVGILSAVAIPLMRGRSEAAKWSEGKLVAGTIQTAIRAYYAEKGPLFNYAGTTFTDLRFAPGDLDGKYFSEGDCTFDITGTNPLTYTITVTAGSMPEAPSVPHAMELTDTGAFTEIP